MITVIPRLMWLEWQPKNCVKRNSGYASQYIAKKNCQKDLHKAEILYYVKKNVQKNFAPMSI